MMNALDVIQYRRHICANAEELNVVVADELAYLIQTVVLNRGICHMVFPGGRSPRGVFEILTRKTLPWSALHLYPSDERCVPQGSSDRNDVLIDELLLSDVHFPEKNLHRIPAELGAEEGAHRYNELLSHVPRFDIAFLGVGEDGHTASLFPGSSTLEDERTVVPVFGSPKPPTDRVSIGLARLREAHERWVVVAGLEKKNILSQMSLRNDLPVNRILPTRLFVDQFASGL